MLITLDQVQLAQTRLKDVARKTPLLRAFRDDDPVWYKPENLQPIGSFKIRGAYNRIAALSPAERAEGVIAYSSGNHAQGVAYAAQRLGIPALIVMPNNAPTVKVEATRSYGAEVVFYDPQTEKREEIAQQLMQGKHYSLVPPYDHPEVIAGQGTISLEVFEDLPDVDLILTPVGGGGLISGVATAIKSLKPSVKVIGVEPTLAADARESFKSGKLTEWTFAQTGRTLADGVRTLSLSDLTFEHIRQYVDDIVTVSEDEIQQALQHIVLKNKLVAEPSGVLPLAAYLFHREELPQTRATVLVISGGNIEPAILAELVKP